MTPSPQHPRAALLQDSNFRWMVSGTAFTLLGDQFTLIALPWLVLQMTGDTLVLGTVLALMSVPRALFILIGGALVDRHSPKQVLMRTKYANLALLGLLSGLMLTGALTLWMVYALSLAIGLATAFSIPAGTAMLPHVVPRTQLQAANGISMGLRQLTMFLGPLLAGLLIALFGDGSRADGTGTGAMANATGIGIAFGLDALSFGVSAWTLSKVRLLAAAQAPSGHTEGSTASTPPAAPGTAAPAVLASVAQGLAHFWRDRELRTCFLYWSAVAILIMGPLHIAMPVLASSLPHLGAAAFGALVGAHGAGTLAGMVASGMLPRLRWGSLGMTLLAFDATIGLLFMPMGVIGALWQGVALMLAIGLLGGFMQVRIFTWIQQRVPPALIGRAMALFMFIFMGLAPISAAATGWAMKGITLAQLFAACGGALVAVAALAFLLTPLRQVNDAPGTVPR
ncbi:MFS transporter [Acidovorax sp. SUPP1855]|uniref:MFS transporter n=1 Tax=Acidovorax sp. SUPP1855 TaxID=431774 RepID=UPI0023DE4AD8|nr:MFS transporter [Acidovorax sp. SUPP1855]GKS86242.1 MFS transporter [Acidovorax sp. SUPP1855]